MDFSDEEEEQTNDEIDFVDDSLGLRENVRFYRNVDLNNVDNYNKFSDQQEIQEPLFMRTMKCFSVQKIPNQSYICQRIEKNLIF